MIDMAMYISILCISLKYMKIEKIRNGEVTLKYIRNVKI